MPSAAIEQALIEPSRDGWTITARSPGWNDEWQANVERLCAGFGRPEPLTHMPLAVFAHPFDRDRVAVVQAAADGAPPMLRFHVLILPNAVYAAIGEPFVVAEQFVPPWGSRVVLPSLAWTEQANDRGVERVRRILQEEDSPTLLGSAQALVDGGRVVFERPFPAADLMRRLWALLPDSARAELWPASLALAPDLGWHAVVVPRYEPADWPGYITEAQAGDYPEGRYELNLQIAAESGDQRLLDKLFARRTSRQTLRLALMMLLAAVALALLLKVL